jgi:chromosome segregation ATPase
MAQITGEQAKQTRAPLSQEEIDRRVAVLKRFRELLRAQRDRFREYLTVLDKQQTTIEQGNSEDLLTHLEMEEQILTDIFTIQKVIDPLENLYRTVTGEAGTPAGTAPDEGEAEISGLKTALEGFKQEAVVRTERNKNLLSKRMAEIRSEIKSLRGNPYAARPSIYADIGSPALIDIEG